jgi:hypothetical protein
MEIVKDIAAVIGMITAGITLLTMIIKPLRQKIVNTIADKAQKQAIEEKIDLMNDKVDTVINDNQVQQQQIQEIIQDITSVKENVLENEADRIRAELFDCGNRCRRGIRLHPEEFDHIKEIYRKYTDVLHQNHEGETEYNFIHQYYNGQQFPSYHQPNQEDVII